MPENRKVLYGNCPEYIEAVLLLVQGAAPPSSHCEEAVYSYAPCVLSERGRRRRITAALKRNSELNTLLQPLLSAGMSAVMAFWTLIFVPVLLTAAAEAAAAAALSLTRKVGEDGVTLSLGDRQLKPGDLVVWFCGPETGKEHRLFEVEIGNHDGPTKRDQFDLDPTTGALTIKPLSATDSAVYYGQIINGDGINRFFNLTVEGSSDSIV
ncbi:uncharacterized protein LOC103472347 isoform X2 [Poecilia reticulata]|uniref:uncharacterized protein LOC103472347 isoform X2 n=1 Tax=Poecilia reticulata TaxID=8081 RepID=UPI0004A37545|nr:PREDICTED: uncharacterized protein LOC103472347 isoform X2 [Poecilia reticulata]